MAGAACVSHDKAGSQERGTGFFECAPDLGGEIVSPGYQPGEVIETVRDYIEAGSSLVWVIDPVKRTATPWRADSTMSSVSESGVLSAEDVRPGFGVPLAIVLP